jgi:hypothetical protein
MTIAQTKAARRRMKNDPRFKRHKNKSAEAKQQRRARKAKQAAAKGKSFGYNKK